MDKVGANPERVMEQLTEYELVPEAWGGDTPCIPVSAHTKQGIDDLLEMIILTADMMELKANPDRAAKGTVIEARLDKGMGPHRHQCWCRTAPCARETLSWRGPPWAACAL